MHGDEPQPPVGDYAVIGDCRTGVLQRIECTEGAVPVDVVCDPRCGSGRRAPDVRPMGASGVLFDGGADALVLATRLVLEPRPDGAGWGGTERPEPGQTRYLSLASEHAAPVTLPPPGPAAGATA